MNCNKDELLKFICSKIISVNIRLKNLPFDLLTGCRSVSVVLGRMTGLHHCSSRLVADELSVFVSSSPLTRQLVMRP